MTSASRRVGTAPTSGATRETIGGGPDEVADALEPEHREEDEEGHHGHASVGVGRAGGGEVGETAGLGDALLEDLTELGLDVGQQQVVVDRSYFWPRDA